MVRENHNQIADELGEGGRGMMDVLLMMMVVITWVSLAIVLIKLDTLNKKFDLIDEHVDIQVDLFRKMIEIDDQRLCKLERWRLDELNKEADKWKNTQGIPDPADD